MDAVNAIKADDASGPAGARGGPTETLTPNAISDLVDAVPRKRMLARYDFVQHHAQGPDVVGFVGGAARQHLRRQIAHGAAPGGGSVAGLASETEVEELGRPVRREPDVARLDVAVHVPHLVQGRESVGQEGADVDGARRRHRPPPKPAPPPARTPPAFLCVRDPRREELEEPLGGIRSGGDD